MTFTDWFEREAALIQSACDKRQTQSTRKTVDTIHIGDAIINLRQLQRALDQTPSDSMHSVAEAWVDTAILRQHAHTPKGHIARVFPHIRPPPDRDNIPWSEPIANDRLMLCLVYDDEEHLRHLNPIDIANFNMGIKGLRERALTNLGRMQPCQLSACQPHSEHPHVWLVSNGDGHDAARILIADQIAGSPVVAWVPHRDLLMFTTLSMSAMRNTASTLRKESIQRAQSSKHPISAEAFLVHKGKITHLPFRKTRSSGQLILPE